VKSTLKADAELAPSWLQLALGLDARPLLHNLYQTRPGRAFTAASLALNLTRTRIAALQLVLTPALNGHYLCLESC
jgi:hypothetical protein